jgi:hypothetical protein
LFIGFPLMRRPQDDLRLATGIDAVQCDLGAEQDVEGALTVLFISLVQVDAGDGQRLVPDLLARILDGAAEDPAVFALVPANGGAEFLDIDADLFRGVFPGVAAGPPFGDVEEVDRWCWGERFHVAPCGAVVGRVGRGSDL